MAYEATKFPGAVAVGEIGNEENVVMATPWMSFAADAASASMGVQLPKGAVILEVIHDGSGTGGSTPTFDVGTTSDPDGIINEGDADIGVGRTTFGDTAAGILLITTGKLTSEDIVAGVGANAATGGTVTFRIVYTIDPALAQDPSGV